MYSLMKCFIVQHLTECEGVSGCNILRIQIYRANTIYCMIDAAHFLMELRVLQTANAVVTV